MMNMFRNVLLAVAVPATMLLAAPAQAIHIGNFVVDDFTFNPRPPGQPPIPAAADTSANLTGVTGSGNGQGSTIMNQLNGGGVWTRNFYAFLTQGDRVETEACVNCQQGHFSSDANSRGYGGFYYEGGSVNLNSYIGQQAYFDYSTDHENADIVMALFSGSTLITTLHWQDLPNTNQILQRASLVLPAADYGNVTFIAFNIYGIGGTAPQYQNIDLGAAAPFALDVDISDIPEPATLALLGIGVAALGFGRRRRA
jgi:hypothetical protein